MFPNRSGQTAVSAPGQHHLKSLDGVRGLAILMVALSHGFESQARDKPIIIRLIDFLLYNGKYGVDLFFVLSGFLITGILIDTRDDPKYFRSFLARRALRILPLYYGVLLILCAVTVPLDLHWNGMLPLLFLYLQNLRPFAINDLSLSPHIALYHFWSLAVEEQFYLFWPLVEFWLRGGKALFQAALLGSAFALVLRITLLVHGAPWLVTHMSTPTRADTLLIGALLAIVYRSTYWSRLQRFAPAVFLVFIPGLIMPGVLIPIGLIGVQETITAICFAALIAWSLKPASMAKRLFEHSPLRFLGKYSYGIYVFHVIVLSALQPFLRSHLLAATHNKLISVAGSGIVCLLVSIPVAYLSFNFYEKPFLRLKRFFAYHSQEASVISL
jgi:peptidoglycan/LPS O-acetylase OafA/YrhL